MGLYNRQRHTLPSFGYNFVQTTQNILTLGWLNRNLEGESGADARVKDVILDNETWVHLVTHAQLMSGHAHHAGNKPQAM